GDAVRTTVEQNIVLRWVAEGDLPDLYRDLRAIDLAAPGAETIVDVTSCPGTDTCKLGIASSRGLAGELRSRLSARRFEMDEAVRGLRIKVSGCFNSCGQHHVADIGFFGNSRKIDGRTVPHFQVILGGRWRDNAGSYGLAIGAIPSKRIPEVVDTITTAFVAGREGEESFQDWISRLGKKELAALIADLKTVPSREDDPSPYTDWGDAREFTMGDMGIGECAGEVIDKTELELSFAESIVFDASVALEDGDLARADERAYAAMLTAAQALVRSEFPNVADDPDAIVDEFRERFYDTERFFDRFAKGRFAHPLFDRHADGPVASNPESVRELVEEAQLFIDAVHALEIRESGAQSALV
ncbi:MAG: nitrite/sulfite reductase, partial [Thermoleophilia bacterium]